MGGPGSPARQRSRVDPKLVPIRRQGGMADCHGATTAWLENRPAIRPRLCAPGERLSPGKRSLRAQSRRRGPIPRAGLCVFVHRVSLHRAEFAQAVHKGRRYVAAGARLRGLGHLLGTMDMLFPVRAPDVLSEAPRCCPSPRDTGPLPRWRVDGKPDGGQRAGAVGSGRTMGVCMCVRRSSRVGDG
jgi:hypothetical protein